MGLRDDVQGALTEAFNGDLSDIVSTFILTRITYGDYNTSTGQRPETETDYNSRGVFETKENINVDGVKTLHEKLIVNAVDLAIEPKMDDQIAVAYGDVYVVDSVIKVMGGDSTAIIYEINLRRNESA